MGYYINTLPNGKRLEMNGKADQLIEDAGAIEIGTPKSFMANLVCVVENSGFDAAAFAYDEEEMKHFKMQDDRQKRWLIVPQAAELSGFSKT